MNTGLKTAVLLIPLSMTLLSFLRLGHYLGKHLDSWSLPKAKSAHNCTHSYSIELLSIDPLIVYINNFLTDQEVDYFVDLKKGHFSNSYVYDENLVSVVDTEYRSSQSATVHPDDAVGSCLMDRMKSLLGNVQHISMEPLQIVKYQGGEKFRLHMDWFDSDLDRTLDPRMPRRRFNRLFSIFTYLDDNCTGGETYFPDVRGVSKSADGTKFSVTETGWGLLVKPRRGNAVLWNNLHANGTGDARVRHASMPVKSGRKMGMNLFSYYFPDAPMVGGDTT